MAFLLDTHAFLWWCEDSPQLSNGARQAIATGDCFVSFVSFWEIAVKFSVGRLGLPAAPEKYVADQMSRNGFAQLELGYRQIMRCASLPWHHRDPFDRLLVAQAMDRQLTLISRDPSFDSYEIPRVW